MKQRIIWSLALVMLMLPAGCANDIQREIKAAATPSEENDPAHAAGIQPSQGFSWVVPGELAAMPRPGRYRPLEEDAAYLEQEGIAVLVSLTEEPPPGEPLGEHAISQFHLPIVDFTPPSLEQMLEFTEIVNASVAAGAPVGVHCAAGLGRSGTMAAAYLVAQGSSADEAIATIRKLRPGSVETPEQEEAVRLFADRLDSNR